MEIKRYPSIYFLMREMRKDLFGVDTNNSTGKVSLLNSQLTNFDFSSECKKISTNKWKKIN
ncbi:hypothetical protein OAB59_02980 [Pelagibacteraceae bacterium]|nr:hypothetical protein [Pelagibacteraceae bacterium]